MLSDNSVWLDHQFLLNWQRNAKLFLFESWAIPRIGWIDLKDFVHFLFFVRLHSFRHLCSIFVVDLSFLEPPIEELLLGLAERPYSDFILEISLYIDFPSHPIRRLGSPINMHGVDVATRIGQICWFIFSSINRHFVNYPRNLLIITTQRALVLLRITSNGDPIASFPVRRRGAIISYLHRIEI